jgi:hypothetical protein
MCDNQVFFANFYHNSNVLVTRIARTNGLLFGKRLLLNQ